MWNPFYKYQKKNIEDVQRRATRLLPSLKDKSYQDRLKALNLPSLEHRRSRGDMIDTYKYVHGIYKTSRPVMNAYTGPEVRCNSLKLARNRTCLNIRTGYFCERVVKTWNSLPNTVVTAPSVNAFKNRLDAHWATDSRFTPTCYD